jgi:hypothetical protein
MLLLLLEQDLAYTLNLMLISILNQKTMVRSILALISIKSSLMIQNKVFDW